MPTIELVIPRPHEHQRQIMDGASRFNVIACGRRFGKTTMGTELIAQVIKYPSAWFAPSYKMLLEVWREFDRVFAPIVAHRSAQERRLEFYGGGHIEFWSLQDENAGRGRKYKRIIVDEAGFVRYLWDIWNASLRPTLADMQGDAFFPGTPKGRNDYWRLYQLGVDPTETEWRSFQKPGYLNPHVPASEFEAMKRSLPERVYRQEILAEFLEDGGGVFRHVMDAVDASVRQDLAQSGSQYIMGVDWGKHNDFTVLTVIDVTLGHVCYVDRFNQIDYTFQVGRLRALYDRFKPAQIIAEQNSMGDPLIEQLRQQSLPVTAFMTTNATKKAAVEALALAFERDEIRIPDEPVLVGELQAFESERLPSGNIRYGAPDGMHDDTVMSLAIGWSGMGKEAAGAISTPSLSNYKSGRGDMDAFKTRRRR